MISELFSKQWKHSVICENDLGVRYNLWNQLRGINKWGFRPLIRSFNWVENKVSPQSVWIRRFLVLLWWNDLFSGAALVITVVKVANMRTAERLNKIEIEGKASFSLKTALTYFQSVKLRRSHFEIFNLEKQKMFRCRYPDKIHTDFCFCCNFSQNHSLSTDRKYE